ncbi:MAG: Fur family transcriptional regulator, ferric uptake regulator [Frankiaceae bacterium]|jgi:Fur family ferric uptake transcriptional regulator|nr:Fur family transcriptional regulator, ferric uptake regulator [Frankiaceae bacterium]
MIATGAGGVTRAQRAVLAALVDAPSFASAQEIHARLRASGETVGLTSVYRALQSLTEVGDVDVLRTDAGEATYRRCDSDRHHHHLVCRHCGAAVEVEAPELERWVADVASRHGYRVDDHTLEISGACGRCATS